MSRVRFRGNLLQVNAPGSLWCAERMIARRVLRADTYSSRARGLALRSSMAPDEALVLEPARQIHTVGMRFDLDVVFCDKDWTVVHIVRGMRPFRVSRWVRRARRVVELPGGSLPEHLEVGAVLEIRS